MTDKNIFRDVALIHSNVATNYCSIVEQELEKNVFEMGM